MNSTIIIRKAVSQDCPRLLELVKELAIFERAPESVTVSLKHFEESGFGEKPVWWAFVAVDSSAGTTPQNIVGFALWYIRYSTWKGQRLYLEDLIVTEAWRGKGIGRQLMDAVVNEAKCYAGMNWQVLDWNEPAIRFYEKYGAGFDAEWLNVSLERSHAS